jgi:hypothetical protein
VVVQDGLRQRFGDQLLVKLKGIDQARASSKRVSAVCLAITPARTYFHKVLDTSLWKREAANTISLPSRAPMNPAT